MQAGVYATSWTKPFEGNNDDRASKQWCDSNYTLVSLAFHLPNVADDLARLLVRQCDSKSTWAGIS